MTQEVQIIIEGTLSGDGENQKITTNIQGTYHLKNEKHFIHYEEYNEDRALIKNSIKISSKEVVMSKKGLQGTKMIFDLAAMTMAHYDTPYGNFIFGIKTKKMDVRVEEDIIQVELDYSLSAEDGPISENSVSIRIESIKE